MNPSKPEADTLLAIDVGSSNTRALLFDIAEGQYHFVAGGQAATTAGAPDRNVSEGIRQALESLQKISGRMLSTHDDPVILPTRADGTGVDTLVATFSAGRPLRIVIVGLLNEVSLESAQRLARGTYGEVIETIGLNDRRRSEEQIDAIIQARPDLVIVVGGTENGASRSILRLIEVVGLACYLIPTERRPSVLYAGNSTLVDKVRAQLEQLTGLRTAANIRPSFEHEDLGPALSCLNEIAVAVRGARMEGVAELVDLANGHGFTTAYQFGRVIRFLSQVYDPAKGVMGVDLGAGSTTIAAAISGRLALDIQAPLGMGEGISGVIERFTPAEILQWVSVAATEDEVLDYLHQKQAFPRSLPVTAEEMAYAQAVARVILRAAARGISGRALPQGISIQPGLTPPYEPVLVTGQVVTQAPTAGQSLMMLLDGLQPVGITTFVLDQNNLTAALGAAAGINPLIPVQVLESGAYTHLGTVVSPVSSAPFGTPILRARLVYADKNETKVEIQHGTIHLLPLARGESAQLYLEPLGHTDLAMVRPGRGVRVTGGVLGAVIDARGRPLRLPDDPAKRLDLHKKWLWTLGG